MQVNELIDRLVRFEPTGFPFISLYLDTRADQHGRDRFDVFVRKELPARARRFPERSAEAESFARDIERITAYLATEMRASAKALALFACAGADGFIEAVQLDVPLVESQLFVGPTPHVHPLARVHDRYRRYAAVVADTDTARIFVFGLGELEARNDIQNTKMPRTESGGWSQARYQRHIDELRQQHVKELVGALERVVREEQIDAIVLAGDEVVMPMIRRELPKMLAERVVDVLSLDIAAPERQVLDETLRVVRDQDARGEAEKARRMLDAYRAGGLAVVGLHDTLRALEIGQVHELLLLADPSAIRRDDDRPAAEVADELVSKARQTGARVTFIEDSTLLAQAGGVGAILRYQIAWRAA